MSAALRRSVSVIGVRVIVAASVVVIAAIAATIALATGGPSAAATPAPPQGSVPPERLAPVSFEGHFGRATRRRLPVTFTTGVCADALRFSELREGRRTVAVRFDEVFRGEADRVCPAIAMYRCFTIVLRTPLAGRRVIDAARGTRIGRLRKEPQFTNATPCPRVAAPPVDLAPPRLDG